MDTRNTMEQDEVVIDLKHLVFAVLKQWKLLIALGVIGVALGLGLSGPKESAVEIRPEMLAEMETASSYRKMYNRERKVLQQSPYLQLNSDALYAGNLVYYVWTEKNAGYVADQFAAALRDPALEAELRTALAVGEIEDLNQLVRFSALPSMEVRIADQTAQTDAKAPTSVRVSGATEKRVVFAENCLKIQVNVFAAQKENQRAAAALIRDAMEKRASELSGKGALELELIEDTCALRDSDVIRNAQMKQVEALQEIHEAYEYLEEIWSEDAGLQDVYERCFLAEKPVAISDMRITTGRSFKKAILLGLVFGFLGCMGFAAADLMSGKVKTPDEAGDRFGLRLVGYVAGEPEKKKNVIDRWLVRMERNAYPEAVSPAYIRQALTKLGGRTVILCDETDAPLWQMAQQVADGGDVLCCDLLSRSEQTMRAVNAGDCVVLAARMDKTKYSQIEHEMDVCRQQGMKLNGIVICG